MVMYSLLIGSLYGMDEQLFVDVKVGGTTICVSNQSIDDIDANVDVLVLSMKKQLSLRGEMYRFPVGDVRRIQNNTILVKKKADETTSGDLITEKKMKSTIVLCVEPKKSSIKKELIEQELVMCYKNIFARVAEEVSEIKHHRTIALSKIRCAYGESIPSIAIESAFNFLKDNPDAYSLIHFLVKRTDEFELYKGLLAAMADKNLEVRS